MPRIVLGEQRNLFTLCPSETHTDQQHARGLCDCRELECGHIAPRSDRCAHCHQCHDHGCCQCDYCEGCDSYHAEGSNCADCERCSACCSCRVRGEVPFNHGRLTFFPSLHGDPTKPATVIPATKLKVLAMRRHMSVELEVDHFTSTSGGALRPVTQKWHDAVVTDGSLSGGFEVNTNPSAGDFFAEHIRDYANAFRQMGPARAGINCGMHVHANARDYSQYDLAKLLKLYEKFERAVFDACEPRRLNGRFCQLCSAFYATKDVKPKEFRANLQHKMYGSQMGDYYRLSQIRSFQPPARLNGEMLAAYRRRCEIARCEYDRRSRRVPLVRADNRRDVVLPSREVGRFLKEQKQQKYYHSRYKALNVHSFFYRGTIEWRHKEGLTKYDDIIGWTHLIATIMDSALALGDKDIKSLPPNSRNALLEILPANLKSWVTDTWTRFDRSITPRMDAYKRQVWASHAVDRAPNPGEYE